MRIFDCAGVHAPNPTALFKVNCIYYVFKLISQFLCQSGVVFSLHIYPGSLCLGRTFDSASLTATFSRPLLLHSVKPAVALIGVSLSPFTLPLGLSTLHPCIQRRSHGKLRQVNGNVFCDCTSSGFLSHTTRYIKLANKHLRLTGVSFYPHLQ